MPVRFKKTTVKGTTSTIVGLVCNALEEHFVNGFGWIRDTVNTNKYYTDNEHNLSIELTSSSASTNNKILGKNIVLDENICPYKYIPIPGTVSSGSACNILSITLGTTKVFGITFHTNSSIDVNMNYLNLIYAVGKDLDTNADIPLLISTEKSFNNDLLQTYNDGLMSAITADNLERKNLSFTNGVTYNLSQYIDAHPLIFGDLNIIVPGVYVCDEHNLNSFSQGSGNIIINNREFIFCKNINSCMSVLVEVPQN